ncbi:MAG: universal stress protein [Synechococcales cyanobacterium RU_4_20]|nr:universal stress protein [Synechococcales cyanobacterium RU_4_20]
MAELLVPYDGSRSAHHTLSQIKQRVTQHPQTGLKGCILVWVIDTASRFPKDEAEVKAKLGAAKADLESVGLKVETRLLRGLPMEQLMRAATVENISAIALSDSKPNRLLDWSVSSFGTEVLRQSWHPVLFFPPDESAKMP